MKKKIVTEPLEKEVQHALRSRYNALLTGNNAPEFLKSERDGKGQQQTQDVHKLFEGIYDSSSRDQAGDENRKLA